MFDRSSTHDFLEQLAKAVVRTDNVKLGWLKAHPLIEVIVRFVTDPAVGLARTCTRE